MARPLGLRHFCFWDAVRRGVSGTAASESGGPVEMPFGGGSVVERVGMLRLRLSFAFCEAQSSISMTLEKTTFRIRLMKGDCGAVWGMWSGGGRGIGSIRRTAVTWRRWNSWWRRRGAGLWRRSLMEITSITISLWMAATAYGGCR